MNNGTYFYCIVVVSISVSIQAQKNFMIGGWVPYWRTKAAMESIKPNYTILDEFSLFSLEMDNHGNLANPFKYCRQICNELHAACKQSKKPFIATIYWTDTHAIHQVLCNKERREEHIRQILEAAAHYGFDGININYEKASGKDREDYILFLRRLSQELHKRGLVLHTTIGGRTGDNTIGILYPGHHINSAEAVRNLEKQRKKVHVSLNPGKGEAAVRYKKALVECCDCIIIMGYDECGRPYHYNKKCRADKYYMSLASNQWTEQILQYALSFIPKHKLVLALPTYGFDYGIYPRSDGSIAIDKRRNITFSKAHSLANVHRAKPKRTAGGELSFTYKKGAEERYVCFLDAQATKDRIKLAKKYDIKGVYLFTLNGDIDGSIWKALRESYA